MESSWRSTPNEIGSQYTGIKLASLLLTDPPGGPWPVPMWLAGIRVPAGIFYQFLAVANVDYPPVSVFTSDWLPDDARFPYGFDVAPDLH